MSEAFDAYAWLSPAELPAGLVAPQNITTLRWATAGYATRGTDLPASTPWLPRVLGDVTLAQSAIDGLGFGGVVALATGEIPLWDGDNALADLDRYGVADNRALRLRVLPVANAVASDFGQPFSAAVLAFQGVARSVRRGANQRGSIEVGDITDRFAVPLQPLRYLGTGGLEGGPELKDAPKPVTLGRVYNLAPVYVGRVNLGDGLLDTYQVHWRSFQALDAVRIRGVEQTLVGTAPGVGQARAWLAQGVFQLGGSPDGAVTADVRGDAVGGYVGTTAGIVKRLLESLNPGLGTQDLDATSFAFADVDLPGEIGIYIGAQPVTAAAVLGDICAGSGAVVAGGRGGLVRIFDPIARAAAQFTLEPQQILACEPVPLPATLRPLPIAVAIGWRPNRFPLGQDVAGAVPAAVRQQLTSAASGPERVLALATLARQAQQRDLVLPGLYWAQADAAARAQRWRDWIEHGPRCVRIVTDRYLGQVELGQVGRFAYPGSGFDTGALGVVLGWREQLAGRRLELTIVTIPES